MVAQVGIAGRTGAGKSSILGVLFQLIPLTGGSILVDGVNISKIPLRLLRSRLSVVPQSPMLFEGTLRSVHIVFAVVSSVDRSYVCLFKVSIQFLKA